MVSHGGGNRKTTDAEINIFEQSPHGTFSSSCRWCIIEGKDGLHVPLTRDGFDVRVHDTIIDIFAAPVVSKLIRNIFLDFHKQSDGCNTAAVQKGRLSLAQCVKILEDWPEETDVTTKEQYEKSCDKKFTTLLEQYGIPYKRLLEADKENCNGEKSVVQRLLKLPTRVGQYAPLVEHTTAFRVLVARCKKLCLLTTCERRLPKPATLTLPDLSFLLFCLHKEGLVALTPSFNIYGPSAVVPTDVISHLLDRQSIRENYQRQLQAGIDNLELLLFEIGKDDDGDPTTIAV